MGFHVRNFSAPCFGFVTFDVLMSSDSDILIKQRIDAPIEVYDEITVDQLKIVIAD